MNDIEEKFYKTFGIKKQRRLWTPKEGFKKYYPQITDRILLKLICIWNNYTNCGDELIMPMDFENLKEKVLERLVTPSVFDCSIDDDEWFIEQVQALFKGEE